MQNELVSIIIPTYNRAHLIGETLDSVMAQTYTNWECIIVDDGSTDNTKEIITFYLEKDKRFSYYSRPEDYKSGGNGARNFGFKVSNGKYIQWFDSDDLMHEELLSKKIAQISLTNTDYCLCKMAAFKIENGKQLILRETIIKSNDILIDFLKKKITIGTPTILWKKALLTNSKLFDETLLQSQDMDFNARMIFQSKNFSVVDDVLVYFRANNQSISSFFFTNIDDYIDSFLKVRENIINFDSKNKIIAEIEIKEVLGVLRYCLASKKYNVGKKIIIFLRKNSHFNEHKIKLERIFLFYQLFKIIKRGETKFKFLLKL